MWLTEIVLVHYKASQLSYFPQSNLPSYFQVIHPPIAILSPHLLPHTTMNTKLFVLASLATAAVAAVGNAPVSDRDIVLSCNSINQQCCNSVQEANPTVVQTILSFVGLFGISQNVGPITSLIGIGCSPVSVIGGNSW